MSLKLAYCPGFVDIPVAAVASGATSSGPALSAIKGNADFGPVAYEQFQVVATNGGNVAPGGGTWSGLSPVDNYLYSLDECTFQWELSGTTNRTTGLPGAAGGLLGGTWNVDQATGDVTCFQIYEVEGGQSGDTSDGVLTVTIHAVRAQQIRTIAAGAPSYTALSETGFTQDEPLFAATIAELSQNAKCASVSVERFMMNPSNAPVWAPEANISANQLVQPTQKYANGCWYIAANSGSTGTVEPGPWPSDPGYQGGITDGTVIWNLAGYGFMNGQQIPLPKSGVDGYQYSAADSIAAIPFFATSFSLPRQTGLTVSFTSGEGDILAMQKTITQTAPTAATATSVGQIAPLNANQSLLYTAKTIYPGMSSPPPAMSLMTANEAGGTETTGCGFLNCRVLYENGWFDDGACHVLLVCTRAFVASVPSGDGAQFTDFATTDVLSGNSLELTTLNQIIQNANFGILRPEIVTTSFTEAEVQAGATVPVPTSRTGYVYSRAELTYVWYWTITGASGGRLRDFDVTVNPTTGVVCTRTDYFLGNYKSSYGNIGTAIYGYPGAPVRSQLPNSTCGVPAVTVITFARRSHETELQAALLLATPATSMPAPPSQNNLLPDPDFQLWSRTQLQAVDVVGVADDWYVGQESGTTAFLQEAGIVPGSTFAQGIGAQCTGDNLSQRAGGPFPSGAPAAASVISDLIAIAPGGLYAAGFMARATPSVINYGLYFRVHLVDINNDNDTSFSLLGTVTSPDGTGTGDNPGSPLETSVQSFSFLFTMPTNGDTSVDTSNGQAVLSQALTFIPAYAYVEILNWAPIYSGYGSGSLVLFAAINKVYLEYQAAASTYLTPAGVALPADLSQPSPTSTTSGIGGTWANGTSSGWYPTGDATSWDAITAYALAAVMAALTASGTLVFGFASNADNQALPAGVNSTYFMVYFGGYFVAAPGTAYTIGVNCSGGVALWLQAQDDFENQSAPSIEINAWTAAQSAASDGTFTNSVQWTAPTLPSSDYSPIYEILIAWQNGAQTPALEVLSGAANASTGTPLQFLSRTVPARQMSLTVPAGTIGNPGSTPISVPIESIVTPGSGTGMDLIAPGATQIPKLQAESNENMIQNPNALVPSGAAQGFHPVPGWSANAIVNTTFGPLPSGQDGPSVELAATGAYDSLYSNSFTFTPGATYEFKGYYVTSGTAGVAWFLYGGPNNIQLAGLGGPTVWTPFSALYAVPISSPPSLQGFMQFVYFSGAAAWILVWGCSVVMVRNLGTQVAEANGNYFAGEHGADITANHTAHDTSNVNGVASALVSPISSLMPAEAGADITSTHTAAAIAGQGALATLSAVDLATQVTNNTLEYLGDGGGRYAGVTASADNTLGQVQTDVATGPSTAVTVNGTTPSAVTGLEWEATIVTTGDTLNINAVVEWSGSLGADIQIFAKVDSGSTEYGLGLGFSQSSSTFQTTIFFAAITGLSAGSHSVQLYASSPNGSTLTIGGSDSYAIMTKVSGQV